MKRKQGRYQIAKGLVLGSIAALGLSLPAFAEEYVVKVKDSRAFAEAAATIAQTKGVQLMSQHSRGSLFKVDIDARNKNALAQSLRQLLQLPNIAYVVPNIKMHTFGVPNDPQIDKQWALEKVRAFDAWDATVGDKNVVVAVIDTGIDTQHEDLRDNIWVNPNEIAGNGIDDDGNGFIDDMNGWDFRENDNNPYDETSSKNPGHGTHCAGIVGAVGNNNKGISGMSQVVSLMAIRFLGSDGSGDLYAAAKSIDYAVDNGAHIISASWGAAVQASGAQPIIDAIGRANEKGVIFIAAAANNGTNNDRKPIYPANVQLPNMIAVAASGPDDTKPQWSNYGIAKVHLSSPGLDIFSTLPEGQYKNLSGTSMATPLVSGLTALLIAANGDVVDGLTARSILQSTGATVGIETACQCRVDAAAAVKHVLEKALTVVPTAATLAVNAKQQFSTFGGKAPFTYESSNTSVATIDDKGLLSSLAEGETSVTVTDAEGTKVSSIGIRVATEQQQGGECPFDPQMCSLLCMWEPTLPWCQ